MGNDREDFEQSCAGDPNPENPLHPGRALYRFANYTAMYLLAGLEPGRAQLQVLHENDECCFAPVGRHDRVLAYERDVRAELAGGGRRQHGWFSVAVTNHTKHEVSGKEKAVIAAAMAGDFGPGDPGWERLPCDVLRGAGVSGGRIVSYGRGEDVPVASNLTPEGRAQNRRVEILIIPQG